jgi:hypothetical protein
MLSSKSLQVASHLEAGYQAFCLPAFSCRPLDLDFPDIPNELIVRRVGDTTVQHTAYLWNIALLCAGPSSIFQFSSILDGILLGAFSVSFTACLVS